jgi:hypothetical protein
MRPMTSVGSSRVAFMFALPPIYAGMRPHDGSKPILVPISEADTKLIVGPPNHVAGAAVAVGRPKPELVWDGICPDGGELRAAGG